MVLDLFVLSLCKHGHISFNPDSSVSVFALLALVLLLVCALCLSFIGMGVGPDSDWFERIATAF